MKYTFLFIFLVVGFNTLSQSYNLQSGINHYHENKYDEALEFLEKEIIKHPKEGKAYYYLSLAHVKKENYIQALSQVNLAINNLFTEDSLLALSWKLKGDIHYHNKEFSQFESSYANALSIKPFDIDIFYERAIKYEERKQYDLAISDILKITEIDEANSPARILLASIYFKQNKLNDALTILNHVLGIESTAQAYLERSKVYSKLENFDLAIIDAFEAFSLEEDNSTFQENFIQLGGKNYPLAISKISTLIKEYPRKDDLRYVRSKLFQNKKDFKNALGDLDVIFENTPDNYVNFYLQDRAILFGHMGLLDKSIKDLTKLISMDSSYSNDYSNRSYAYQLTGQYSKALADLNRAIEINPEEASYYDQRGLLKYKFLNNPTEALQDFNSGLKIDSNCISCYLHRGRYYLSHQKDAKKAQLDFQKVIELDSLIETNSSIKHYGYFELGMFDKAEDWMKKIIQQFPEDENYYDAACLYSLMNKQNLALAFLDTAFQKGFRQFELISTDSDLVNIRRLPLFISLIKRWKSKIEIAKIQESKYIDFKKRSKKVVGTYRIPFKSTGGGLMKVIIKINGMTLEMILDTGASNISLSQTEFDFMIKNKYISNQDIIGKDIYSLATGDSHTSRTILFKKVEIGGLTLENVKGSFSENPNASLLLGQNFLSRFGKVIIDNEKKQLILINN
ncbi:tetratricopeptide repeat protein [Aquirufa sp. OSTEICH-129A]